MALGAILSVFRCPLYCVRGVVVRLSRLSRFAVCWLCVCVSRPVCELLCSCGLLLFVCSCALILFFSVLCAASFVLRTNANHKLITTIHSKPHAGKFFFVSSSASVLFSFACLRFAASCAWPLLVRLPLLSFACTETHGRLCFCFVL